MSAAAEVPADVLAQAEAHLFRHGRPLLAVPRPNDWALVAIPSDDNTHYGLMLHPCSVGGQAILAAGAVCHHSQEEMLQRLFAAAADALSDAPRRFVCGGQTVAIWTVVDGKVVAYGPICVALLSWWCRRSRGGFNIVLDGDTG